MEGGKSPNCSCELFFPSKWILLSVFASLGMVSAEEKSKDKKTRKSWRTYRKEGMRG